MKKFGTPIGAGPGEGKRVGRVGRRGDTALGDGRRRGGRLLRLLGVRGDARQRDVLTGLGGARVQRRRLLVGAVVTRAVLRRALLRRRRGRRRGGGRRADPEDGFGLWVVEVEVVVEGEVGVEVVGAGVVAVTVTAGVVAVTGGHDQDGAHDLCARRKRQRGHGRARRHVLERQRLAAEDRDHHGAAVRGGVGKCGQAEHGDHGRHGHGSDGERPPSQHCGLLLPRYATRKFVPATIKIRLDQDATG